MAYGASANRPQRVPKKSKKKRKPSRTNRGGGTPKAKGR